MRSAYSSGPGLSPRTRANLERGGAEPRVGGFIPAHAGEPLFFRLSEIWETRGPIYAHAG